MGRYAVDWDKYAALSRQAAAEGAVLLRNEDQTLPLRQEETVALFGRMQFHYYKSGTGSGGMVNTKYEVGILDALRSSDAVCLDMELLRVYEDWVAEHPYEKGVGWGKEPWSQTEMPLDDGVVVQSAERADIAVIVIGRTAGEDRDNKPEKGAYYLTDAEEDMLAKVCRAFRRVAVLLNVGNIIDMEWVERYKPGAVLYVWQGGQEGGNAVADVLTGKTAPSGRLADTIACGLEDYPSTANFGGDKEIIYAEDIYVGYRYFETAARDKVLYPFGFGLSYSSFLVKCTEFSSGEQVDACSAIRIIAKVENTGMHSGKEVVQVYASPPQGKLGKPARVLAAYIKTGTLAPGDTQKVEFDIPVSSLASYDDSGITGNKSCYVLEAGRYDIYIGVNVRDTHLAGSFSLPGDLVTEVLTEALAPVKAFKRMKPVEAGGGFVMADEDAPVRTVDMPKRISDNRPADRQCIGNKGIKLADVYDGKASLEDFLDQIADDDLACLVRGEGMCSPKVTPGTAAAYGSVTETLAGFGIPIGCCTDGPSGLRLDCGAHAFSMPNGTCLACTFNTALIEDLFEMTGKELRKNRIDLLLGPGMNIHRHPLNGRNFEYFSEDPYLTGTMAAAQLRGLHRWNVTGTIKHFIANNQEYKRRLTDSVASERALREIYLKGFEIAVREGGAFSVMTTYGAVNGLWTAGSYDLLTTVLRNEWGFNGLVMTDWWADMNDEGGKPSRTNLAAMVRAQNDVYMVTPDSKKQNEADNLLESLRAGRLTRGELLRCAANICRVLMKTPVMDRYLGRLSEEELADMQTAEQEDGMDFNLTYIPVGDDNGVSLDISGMSASKGDSALFGLWLLLNRKYTITIKCRSEATELAQMPVLLYMNNHLEAAFSITGTNGRSIEVSQDIGPYNAPNKYMKLYFSQDGLEIEEIRVCIKNA